MTVVKVRRKVDMLSRGLGVQKMKIQKAKNVDRTTALIKKMGLLAD